MNRPGWLVGSLAAFGVVLLLSLVVHVQHFEASVDGPLHVLAVLVFVGGAGLSLLALAYWHRTNPLGPERSPRIMGWILAIVLVITALGVVGMYVGSETVLPEELLEVLHLNVSVGVALGGLIGTGEAVTIEQERDMAAAKAETATLRERETQLQRERDRFEALFDAIPEPVVTVDVTDGTARVRDVNEAFESTFGHDAAAAVEADINDLIVPDDERSRAEAEWLDKRAANGERVTREVVRTAADGTREFLFRAAPVEIDGDVRQQFGLYVDISERNERAAELERKNERLAEFASVLSHDLRNPLTVAKGRLELGRSECENEHLEAASRALTRMETLIEELLMLAREGERVSDPAPVDLAAAVGTCWSNVVSADASLSVETDATILADESRLYQLLENLLHNAIQHGGDAVTITVGDLEGGFFVEDDGAGIPDEDRESIFEFGYTTVENGTGFGMAIVAEIAAAHGWAVSVTDSESGGARFEITGVEFTDR